MTVGERIKQARKLRNLSRPQLAKASGVPYPTLAGIENSDQKTSTELPALARALGVRIEWLAKGKGPMEGSDSAVSALDRDVLVRALTTARKEIAAAKRSVTAEQEAAVVAYLYSRMIDGAGMRAAAEVVRGMLDAFSISPVKGP